MADELTDLHCQWCKKVVGIALRPGEWMTVATAVVYQEKYYCDGESGRCWQALLSMSRALGKRES